MAIPRMKFTLKSGTSSEGATFRHAHSAPVSTTSQNNPWNNPPMMYAA